MHTEFLIEKYKNSTKNKRLKSLVVTYDSIKNEKPKNEALLYKKKKYQNQPDER